MDMLGHIGNTPRPFPAVHFPQIVAAEKDVAATGLFDTQDIFEKGGLAAAVLAQQDAHLSLGKL